jgi:hypothetical protein
MPIDAVQECSESIDATHALVILTIPLKKKFELQFKESIDNYFNSKNLYVGGLYPFSQDENWKSVQHLENLSEFKKLL